MVIKLNSVFSCFELWCCKNVKIASWFLRRLYFYWKGKSIGEEEWGLEIASEGQEGSLMSYQPSKDFKRQIRQDTEQK